MDNKIKSLLYTNKYNESNYSKLKDIFCKNTIKIKPEYFSLFDYITYYDDVKTLSKIKNIHVRYGYGYYKQCIKYSILNNSVNCLTYIFDTVKNIDIKTATYIIKTFLLKNSV